MGGGTEPEAREDAGQRRSRGLVLLDATGQPRDHWPGGAQWWPEVRAEKSTLI